jgi:sigma-B regulation protein RsbU (phosphoserine phosphatase)
MPTLTDFISTETISQLEETFSQAANAPIRICGIDGKVITRKPCPWRDKCDAPAHEGSLRRVPISVNSQSVGYVCSAAKTDGVERLLRLMSQAIPRLCEREQQLRSRAENLALLYQLTAEFTGKRELQGVLDIVAKTVVKALGAKACSIRLLNDAHTELVIKAVHNLSPDYLNKGPILVSKSLIDQEVLDTLKPVYIADERTDPRVLYGAQARREGLVSALCAPMIFKGRPEGVIRVYTGKKHTFDWFETSLLTAIAAEAAAAIVNARLYVEALASADIKRQLRMAAEVQRQMIPQGPPSIPGFEVGAIYVPCFELGGDFYDFFTLGGTNIGVAVCDVAGKGVRASLLMASVRASLRAHAANIYNMSDVISRVNRDLCDDARMSDFATLFYGVLDYSSMRFTYVNAGHVPPLLVRNGKVRELTTGGGIIGIDPQTTWEHDSFTLQAGDVLMAFTDGLSEGMNFEDEAFGRARIQSAALAAIAQGKNAQGSVQHLLWEMRRFTGLQTKLDDLTLIGIRVL